MSKPGGGPAFPSKTSSHMEVVADPLHPGQMIGRAVTADYGGMTLRDYFAAKAMQACIPARRDQFKNDNEDLDDWDNFFDIIADEAYGIADAMLAARERA